MQNWQAQTSCLVSSSHWSPGNEFGFWYDMIFQIKLLLIAYHSWQTSIFLRSVKSSTHSKMDQSHTRADIDELCWYWWTSLMLCSMGVSRRVHGISTPPYFPWDYAQNSGPRRSLGELLTLITNVPDITTFWTFTWKWSHWIPDHLFTIQTFITPDHLFSIQIFITSELK
jgi:hypothetical protein